MNCNQPLLCRGWLFNITFWYKNINKQNDKASRKHATKQMAKLTNTQIDALVSEARQRIEDANLEKVNKLAKTNKKLAEYLKLRKQYEDICNKRNQLDSALMNMRSDMNSSADFVKNNFSINYDGKLSIDTWRLGNELRNKLVIHTIGKDFDVNEVLNNLIKEYIK